MNVLFKSRSAHKCSADCLYCNRLPEIIVAKEAVFLSLFYSNVDRSCSWLFLQQISDADSLVSGWWVSLIDEQHLSKDLQQQPRQPASPAHLLQRPRDVRWWRHIGLYISCRCRSRSTCVCPGVSVCSLRIANDRCALLLDLNRAWSSMTVQNSGPRLEATDVRECIINVIFFKIQERLFCFLNVTSKRRKRYRRQFFKSSPFRSISSRWLLLCTLEQLNIHTTLLTRKPS